MTPEPRFGVETSATAKQVVSRRVKAQHRACAMITIIASLWAVDGDIDRLQVYEEKALTLVAKHGGRLLVAFRPHQQGIDSPDEIHVIQFPSTDALARFMADPDRAALEATRASTIAATRIQISHKDVTERYT